MKTQILLIYRFFYSSIIVVVILIATKLPPTTKLYMPYGGLMSIATNLSNYVLQWGTRGEVQCPTQHPALISRTAAPSTEQ